MDRKFYIGTASLIVLVILVFWGSEIFSLLGITEKIEARGFGGSVIEVKGNSIITEGFYAVSDFQNQNLQGRPPKTKRVEVLIDSETKFFKTLLYLPSAEEVEATGGRYDPAKLKREESAGSLEEIKEMEGGISITAKSEINIYDRDRFFASEINYIAPVYP